MINVYRRELRTSVVVGLVLALLVLVGGAAYALLEPRRWTAQASLVLLPSSSLSQLDQANYFETLSANQIVATFAEVAQNRRFADQAKTQLGFTGAQQDSSSVAVTVVPDTSVILVSATAASAGTAEQLADRTGTLASAYFTKITAPYTVQVVHPASGDAAVAGTSPTVIALAAVAAAVATGLALQQAVYGVLVARRRVQAATQLPPAPADEPLPRQVERTGGPA